jgi:hypothetical protein
MRRHDASSPLDGTPAGQVHVVPRGATGATCTSSDFAASSMSSRDAVARDVAAMLSYFLVLMPPSKPFGPASRSRFMTLRWRPVRSLLP